MTQPVVNTAARRPIPQDPEIAADSPSSHRAASGAKKAGASSAGSVQRNPWEALERAGSSPAPRYPDLSRLAGRATETTPRAAASEAAPSSAPSTSPMEQALRGAARQRAAVLTLNRAVAEASRQVRTIDPLAERMVGVAGMATTAPALLGGAVHSLVTWDGSPLHHAADEADRSYRYAAGELGAKIAEANAAYDTYTARLQEYLGANDRYRNALGAHDYERAAPEAARMEQLVGQIEESARRFGALASAVGKATKKFDGDVVATAIHMHASALTAGGFWGLHGAVPGTGAGHFVADLGKHIAVDAAIAKGLTAGQDHD